MAVNPQLAMLFTQLAMNIPQLASQAPTLFKGLKNAASSEHNSFGRDLTTNAIAATQEAVNRGYDLGLLEESAKSWDDGLPMSIMQDPIVGGGEGAVVDLNNKPIYTTTGDGQVHPYMVGSRAGTGDLNEDELQILYKHLLNKNKT